MSKFSRALRKVGRVVQKVSKPIYKAFEKTVIHAVVPQPIRKTFDLFVGAPAKQAYRQYQAERFERKQARQQSQDTEVIQQIHQEHQRHYQQRIQQLENHLSQLMEMRGYQNQEQKVNMILGRMENQQNSHQQFLRDLYA